MNRTRRSLVKVLVLVLLLGWVPRTYTVEPVNLDFRKQDVIRYHDSGAYDFDIHTVVTEARVYLRQRAAENARKDRQARLAVVFDIDETALSNWRSLVKLGFGGAPETIAHLIAEGKDPAIPQTLSLYREAVSLGVSVFFITGRHERLRTPTTKNLRDAGYTEWVELSMKPNDYANKSVIPFKSGVRKKIVEQGYTIVVNIGDQYSDLAGGYAERVFKLPDPFYYIP